MLDHLVLHYDNLWSSGAYLGPHGEHVASFRYGGSVVEITDETDRVVLRIVKYRDPLGIKRPPDLPRRSAMRFRPRSGFALVDDCDETVGLLWPNSTVLASHWLLRLETADQRATLRARTALAQWNAEHTSKHLFFDLAPVTAGAATVSFGWDDQFSPATAIQIEGLSSVFGALRLLVVAAPLCLPFAGLTGLFIPPPGHGS